MFSLISWKHRLGFHGECPPRVCKKAAAEYNRIESEQRMEDYLAQKRRRFENNYEKRETDGQTN